MTAASPDDLETVGRIDRVDREWISVNACPICGSRSDRHQPFAAHAAGDALIRYAFCRRCGLVFQAPRLSQESLDRLYHHEYRLRSHSQESDPNKDRWVQEQRAEHLAGVLRRHRSQIHRHLDVGSSTGVLLSAFGRNFGSAGYGVEPGEADRAEAEALGLHTSATIEQLPREAAGSFDLVTLSHVLEHLPDPVGVLGRLRREWMTADGIMLIETPDLYCHPSFELGHLVVFSVPTLATALSAAGFEAVEIRRHGKPYSRLLPMFLLAVAQTAPQIAEPVLRSPRPGWIRLRRWLGLTRLRLARLAARMLLGRRRLQPWVE